MAEEKGGSAGGEPFDVEKHIDNLESLSKLKALAHFIDDPVIEARIGQLQDKVNDGQGLMGGGEQG